MEGSSPNGGIVNFLEGNNLTDGFGGKQSAVDGSSSPLNSSQRSKSAVNMQLKANSMGHRLDLLSASIMSQSLIGRWGQVSSHMTPMSEMLSSQLIHEGSPEGHRSCINQNLQTKSGRVGPEEFMEMLRRRKFQEVTPSSARRRTFSENQTSSPVKLPGIPRGKYHPELQRPQVTRHWSYDSPPPRSSLKSAFYDHKSFEERTKNSYCEDAMINFPKLILGSPKSPLNEIYQFGSSPSEHLLIWKEANKEDRIIKVSSADDDRIEEVGMEMSFEKMVDIILRTHKAYNAMPQHARCIVLDLRLKVGSAFDALAYDGIHAAPLWDDNSSSFVGMLTMTDFIHILQQYLDQPEVLSMVRDDQVSKWRDHLLLSGQIFPCGKALTTSVDSSLDEVISHLLDNKVHRVIVTDPETNNALYIATFRHILKYLWGKLPSLIQMPARVMNRSIEELDIGSYGNLVSVSSLTPVSEIFSILLSCRLSAIPVVDENFCVVNLFRKADVMSLILDGSFNDLYCPVRDVLDYERNGFEGLYKCQKTDSAYNIISSFVMHGLHRVVVVDENGRLEGIVTLSDIIKFLVDGERMELGT